MISWIIWFWALLCPNHNHTPQNHGNCNLIHVSVNSLDDDGGDDDGDDGDTGGETGNPPPPPPPPPRG